MILHVAVHLSVCDHLSIRKYKGLSFVKQQIGNNTTHSVSIEGPWPTCREEIKNTKEMPKVYFLAHLIYIRA
jgi:hypothetical protein